MDEMACMTVREDGGEDTGSRGLTSRLDGRHRESRWGEGEEPGGAGLDLPLVAVGDGPGEIRASEERIG